MPFRQRAPKYIGPRCHDKLNILNGPNITQGLSWEYLQGFEGQASDTTGRVL